jgi:hypothetical protein
MQFPGRRRNFPNYNFDGGGLWTLGISEYAHAALAIWQAWPVPTPTASPARRDTVAADLAPQRVPGEFRRQRRAVRGFGYFNKALVVARQRKGGTAASCRGR